MNITIQTSEFIRKLREEHARIREELERLGRRPARDPASGVPVGFIRRRLKGKKGFGNVTK